MITELNTMLKNQAGRLSIGRLASVLMLCLYVFVTLYTLILKQTYAHYDTLAIFTATMFFVVLMSKTVDSRVISIKSNTTDNKR